MIMFIFGQFDRLEKMFYTSINSMSRTLRTIFLPQAPIMYNNDDKNTIVMTKVGIIRNDILVLMVLSMYSL